MEIYFEDSKRILDPRRFFCYHGVRSVASENKEGLEKVAEKAWLESDEPNQMLPDMVLIRDSQTIEVGEHTLHYASAVGYIGN